MSRKVDEAIVLAGGFGTRLRHIVSDVPKPMAPVAGLPFLLYVLERLRAGGVRRVVLSTGYKHECIERFFGESYKGMPLVYSRETEPLFTGGAIKKAMECIEGKSVFVLNGDTLFDVDFHRLAEFHCSRAVPLTVALKHMDDTGRYGNVSLGVDARIIGFREKADNLGAGWINGGIYVVDKEWFCQVAPAERFSFEQEVLQKRYESDVFCGVPFDDYFIDIGVPADYEKAQADFATGLFLSLPSAESMTGKRYLFLDRDGVINRRIVGGYVTSVDRFEFLPGVPEALARLAGRFDRIFIVTNQQGIGKGLFSEADLRSVHAFMMQRLGQAGARIDAVYHCPDLASADSRNRKPAVGMAEQAKRDFPEVDFSRAVMVGDSISDLQFARNAGMSSVFLATEIPEDATFARYTDWLFPDLLSFAEYLLPLK